MDIYDKVNEAIEALKRRELIIVIDSEDRENEGDLIGIASTITPQQVNFMIKKGGGLICIAMEKSRLHALELPQMVTNNQDHRKTRFAISVDAVDTHTGISASERAHTLNLLADPNIGKENFIRPGHIFPLECHEGGIFNRPGHTESAVALAHEAGFYPAGVICEILNPDGSVARKSELITFAHRHKLKIITVDAIIEYFKKTISIKQ